MGDISSQVNRGIWGVSGYNGLTYDEVQQLQVNHQEGQQMGTRIVERDHQETNRVRTGIVHGD